MRVRDARPGDHEDFRRFLAELGADQPPPDFATWNAHLRPRTLFLETDTGELAAYALCFPLGPRGDVRQIVVAPAWRGRGVGRELMAVVAARLRAEGCLDWRLEVRADNAPAIALYTAVGMRVLHDVCVVRMTSIDARGFAKPGDATRVTPTDDHVLEARFDLGTGAIARWRARRPNATFWQLPDAGLVSYWGDFTPERALLFPFRAVRPEHAAALLHAVLADGAPPNLELHVVDPSIAEALVAAGGHIHERMFEMGGALSLSS